MVWFSVLVQSCIRKHIRYTQLGIVLLDFRACLAKKKLFAGEVFRKKNRKRVIIWYKKVLIGLSQRRFYSRV